MPDPLIKLGRGRRGIGKGMRSASEGNLTEELDIIVLKILDAVFGVGFIVQ